MSSLIWVTPIRDIETVTQVDVLRLGWINRGEYLVLISVSSAGGWYQVGRVGALNRNGWVRKEEMRRMSPLEQLAMSAE